MQRHTLNPGQEISMKEKERKIQKLKPNHVYKKEVQSKMEAEGCTLQIKYRNLRAFDESSSRRQ